MADVSITASSVQSTPTTVVDRGTAGTTITAGQVLYRDASDSNKLKLALATNLAAAQVAGIALHGAASGQPIAFATGGDLTLNGLTGGVVYVLSANAGAIAPSADLDTSSNTNYATVLGVASSATNLKLAIKAGGVVNP